MLECLKFIFSLILEFLNMLFTIDVGFTNLGIVMCVTFIFLPMIISIVDFLKASSGDVSFALLTSNTETKKEKKGGK